MIAGIGKSKESDAQLVERMREGDTSAFEIIVERYRAVLIARANARLGSLADAEDVTQDAFVQAYLRLGELREPSALMSWLLRVTERLALGRLRGRCEQPVDPQIIESIAGRNQPNGTPTDATDIDCILSQLPEPMRETVSLTLLGGYTCAEAASIMGVREGTVKSRLSRARMKLKEVLGVKEQDMARGHATSEFTRRTVERLKREARRLIADGNVEAATETAERVLTEQVKPLYGDPEKLGLAKTLLAAFDSGSFKPDEEAVSMLGLSRKEQRRRECESNAAQYGFKLEDLDWEIADVNMMSGTLGRPTGQGRDVWGVPVSRMELDIIDARRLCQRLRVSPFTLYEWVRLGCPILRCWPFARFDVERVSKWLEKNAISDWPTEDDYALERPIRTIFAAVYEGQVSAEQAEVTMQSLGHGVWEAPMPQLKGEW